MVELNTSTANLSKLQNFIAQARRGAGENADIGIYGKKVGGEIVLFTRDKGSESIMERLKHGVKNLFGKERNLGEQGIHAIFNRFLDNVQTSQSSDNVKDAVTFIANTFKGNVLDNARGMDGDSIKENSALRANEVLDNALQQLQNIADMSLGLAIQSEKPALKSMEDLTNLPSFNNNSFDASATKSIETQQNMRIDLPEMKIGEKTYEPERYLTSGGFGDVFIYHDKTDENQKIIVKVSKPGVSPDEIFREISSHEKAVSGGSDNVTGLLGAATFKNAQTGKAAVGIAIEYASLGDVSGAAQRLEASISTDQNVPPGKINKEEADLIRLTLMQDMFKGLDQIHSNGNMMHLDVKNQNYLITQNGIAKIADFGNSNLSESITMGEMPEIATFQSVAPEVLYAKDVRGDIISLHDIKDYRDLSETVFKIFEKTGKSKEQITDIFYKQIQDIKVEMKFFREKDIHSGVVNQSFDVWALGSASIELFTGKRMLENVVGRGPELARRVGEFQHLENPVAVQPLTNEGQLQPNALSGSTGDDGIDGLLNAILEPNPELRPTASDVLTMPTFQRAGVGSPEARNLLKAIMGGNVDEIAQARENLRNLIG